MAGNTKLMGLLPNDSIQLERWGKKVAVGITSESMINIRNALATLPSKPPEQQDGNNGFNVRYDERVGRIHVVMDIGTARDVASVLGDVEGSLLTEAGTSIVQSWVHSLKEAVQAHLDYHNIEEEPGVQGSH